MLVIGTEVQVTAGLQSHGSSSTGAGFAVVDVIVVGGEADDP